MNPTQIVETRSTVFVVDDEPSVRKGLSRLLKSAGYVVEAFVSARDFLDRITRGDSAGCVILDVRMPGLSGLDLQQDLKAFAPPITIIFITGHGDIPMSVRAMKDGATDFLAKPIHDQDLLKAVEAALARNAEDRRRYAEMKELQSRAAALTPREFEVMALVVRGRLNKQVADELGTVEKTVKVHRARVMEKMKVASLADLVIAAEKLGIRAGEAASLALLASNIPAARGQFPQRHPGPRSNRHQKAREGKAETPESGKRKRGQRKRKRSKAACRAVARRAKAGKRKQKVRSSPPHLA